MARSAKNRAFRSNLLAAPKGFPLQSLARPGGFQDIEQALTDMYPDDKDISSIVSEAFSPRYEIDENAGVLMAAEQPEESYGADPSKEDAKLEDYFPSGEKFPQRELIEGSEHSLYMKIQTDSNVEKNFIEKNIKTEDREGKIICYFKFPAKFKIYIPKIFGNYYNPDWSIIRQDKKGGVKVQLVRETKGSADLSKLRFSNEARKIKCGKKHFQAIGVSYRHVTDTTPGWYMDE